MSKFIKLSVSYLFLADSEATKRQIEKPVETVFNTDCIKRTVFDTQYNYPSVLVVIGDSFENYLVHNETLNSLYEKLRK